MFATLPDASACSSSPSSRGGPQGSDPTPPEPAVAAAVRVRGATGSGDCGDMAPRGSRRCDSRCGRYQPPRLSPPGLRVLVLGAFGGYRREGADRDRDPLPTFPESRRRRSSRSSTPSSGVFSLTVLTNTVLLALAYPLGLAATSSGGARRRCSSRAGGDRPAAGRHGRSRTTRGRPGTRHAPDDTCAGGTGDARGPARESRPLPRPRQRRRDARPTDGGTHVVGPRTDGDRDRSRRRGGADRPGDDPPPPSDLEEIDHGAYGTDAETLRGGLAVVARKDRVLVSPGMPFVVPMAIGLVVSLTFGDALFAVLARSASSEQSGWFENRYRAR